MNVNNISSPINLWGDAFKLPEVDTKELVKKLSSSKSLRHSKKASNEMPIADKLSLIYTEVDRVLGKYRDKTLVIHSKEQLHQYVDSAIKNGIIAIDTETNHSLDPLTCKLMGGCIYTPGEKQCYIPINHWDYKTKIKWPWQCTEQDIKEEFSRLTNVKIIMHNGKFDYKVIHCTCGLDLSIYWDTMTAARMLDENEKSAGLKQQYVDKIDPDQEPYNIEKLFNSVDYEDVDPEYFALYSAMDPYMTYKLYEWQVNRFKDSSLKGVYSVFMNMEMPLIIVVAKMELKGISIDKEYTERLNKKYSALEKDCTDKINAELDKYKPKIEQWKLTPEANKKVEGWKELTNIQTDKLLKKTNIKSASDLSALYPKKYSVKSTDTGFVLCQWTVFKSKIEQLEDPISLDSPTQLSIFLYDILGLPRLETKNYKGNSSTGTGFDILGELAKKEKLPLIDLVLQRRTIHKIHHDFIEKLPKQAGIDGRIHCQFNSTGTDTGRFSSSDPNLQQIPARNKEIRMMFCAPKGYKLVAADLSACEVRTCANASQDPDMLDAYRKGLDLYSVIASKIYNNKYEEDLEYYPEGTEIIFEGKKIITGKKTHINKEGKQRRQASKSVLIGLIYGRGASSIAEQTGQNKEETQDIIDKFYKSYPRCKQWMDETHDFVHKHGYIDDAFGRRRRLPEAQYNKYDVEYIDKKKNTTFNPLLGCNSKVNDVLITKYKNLLSKNLYKKELDDIKRRAKVEGIIIHDNTGYISQAERQSVNFQCQSAGADMNKLALIAIDRSQEMKDLHFTPLLTIHDEIIGECPDEYADKVAEVLPNILTSAGGDIMKCPMKADATKFQNWYEDDEISSLNDEYANLLKDNSEDEAYNKLVAEHPELLESQIRGVMKEHKEFLF